MKRFAAAAGFLAAMVLTATAFGADGTLRVATGALPPHLGNPYATASQPSITTTSAIYDGLTRLTRDGGVEPRLAVAWRTVDEYTWRFELRRGVMFSNGVPFTAEAVAAAVNYLASPGANPIDNLKRELPPLAGAAIVDDYTVDITTAAPEPLFPRYASALLIPESRAYAALGREGFMQTPVGTGPFQLESWAPNQASFTAFAGSWHPPKVARLEVLNLPEKAARVNAILTGRADVAIGLGPEDVALVENGGGTSQTWTDGAVQAINVVSTRDLPFNDVRVRRALNMAVNRQPIIDVLLHGATVAANQPAAREAFGYNPDLPQYPYDPERAKALLAEAGYPGGFSFTLETSAGGASAEEVFQQVAADLAKIGVKMEIRVMAGPQYLRNLFQTGEYGDAVTLLWPSAPALDGIRGLRFHSCLHLFPWYCDESIMPKIAEAYAEWDETRARDLRREIMAYYHDQAAAVFLYEQVIFAGLSARVRHFADTYGFINYDEVSLAE